MERNLEIAKEKDVGTTSFRGSSTFASSTNCPACGAESRRLSAKFCFTCGKLLLEDYQPLDTLRASNRLQGKSFLVENLARKEVPDIFRREENEVSQTAWACCVYSMVPYLGILFIPFTVILGVSGVAVSYRRPHLGGRNLALTSVGLSFGILIIQVFFWALLYLIPEIGKSI
jgi:hypothetical protein